MTKSSQKQETIPSVPVLNQKAKVPLTCDELPVCSDGTIQPVFCKAYHRKGIATAWTANDCLGKRTIYDEACRLGVQPNEIGEPRCIPDPSRGECPYSKKFCTYEFKPSRCRAMSYNGQAVSPNFQLIGSGSNPCTAEQALFQNACTEGLIPSLLGNIQCEKDDVGDECPINFECSPQKHQKTKCVVKKYGKIKLKPRWRSVGRNECFAKYYLRVRACRYANLQNKLKPSMLGEITCKEVP